MKYSGASFFNETEKQYLASCCIQLSVLTSPYVAENILSQLIGLAVRQTGEEKFIDVVMWHFKENELVKKFNYGIVLNVLTAILNETGGRSLLRVDYIKLLEELCYNLQDMSNNAKMSSLMIIKRLYTLDPQLISANIQSRDTKLIQCIELLVQQNGGNVIPNAAPNQDQLSMQRVQQQSPQQQVGIQNFNQIQEDSAREEYNTAREYAQDSSYADQDFTGEEEEYEEDVLEDLSDHVQHPLLLKQVDAFIKNILEVEEDYALKYLMYMKAWVDDPQFEEPIEFRSNWILVKTIKYTQEFSANGIDLQMQTHYDQVFDIISGFTEKSCFMAQLEENTIFDVIDTVKNLLTPLVFVIASWRK